MIANETLALNSTYLITYLSSLPGEAVKGDVFAISISLIILYFVILFIQKISSLLFLVFKKIVLLLIVSLAFYEFLRTLTNKISIEGITASTVIFGAIGSVIGICAFTIAGYVAFHSIKKINSPAEAETRTVEGISETETSQDSAHGIQQIDMPADESKKVTSGVKDRIYQELSFEALKSDKRIGAVVAYIIIAEFGVFSSKTIAAPTVQAGMVFFLAFIVASLVFIKFTYLDYYRGLRHLCAALMVGGALSIILGAFWGNIPLEQLLSLQYFTTDALVALVTALTLSLFMGSLH